MAGRILIQLKLRALSEEGFKSSSAAVPDKESDALADKLTKHGVIHFFQNRLSSKASAASAASSSPAPMATTSAAGATGLPAAAADAAGNAAEAAGEGNGQTAARRPHFNAGKRPMAHCPGCKRVVEPAARKCPTCTYDIKAHRQQRRATQLAEKGKKVRIAPLEGYNQAMKKVKEIAACCPGAEFMVGVVATDVKGQGATKNSQLLRFEGTGPVFHQLLQASGLQKATQRALAARQAYDEAKGHQLPSLSNNDAQDMERFLAHIKKQRLIKQMKQEAVTVEGLSNLAPDMLKMLGVTVGEMVGITTAAKAWATKGKQQT